MSTATTMTERQLQDAIIEAAKRMNWLCYHVYDSRRSVPGFPDLVLLKGQRMMVLELKTDKGRVRPEQHVWLDAFVQAGITAKIIRPADLDDVLAQLQEAA
jgi:VRR-NUC domain.